VAPAIHCHHQVLCRGHEGQWVTQLNQDEIEGMLTGPFLTDVRGGPGALAASPEGLLWRLWSAKRNRSGLVEWALISKWEAGWHASGRWVVAVSYDSAVGNGCFRLYLSTSSAPIRLTDSVRPYLPAARLDVDLPS
jgi:hypothetical protein